MPKIQTFQLFDKLQELEFSIKSHHGVTTLMAENDSINENLYFLLNGIGDKLQSTFSELEEMIKVIVV